MGKVAILTKSGAANDANFDKVITFSFQSGFWEHLSRQDPRKSSGFDSQEWQM